MAVKASKTIRIRWVRSGIGFSYRAKEMIRSLGLRRLHQIVERPDTPQIRGLVARIPHLVEVVNERLVAPLTGVPEYTLGPAELAPLEKAAPVSEEPAVHAAATEVQKPAGQAEPKKPAREPAREAPRAAKSPKAREAAKPRAEEKGKAAKAVAAKKEKVAASKGAKPAKKGKK